MEEIYLKQDPISKRFYRVDADGNPWQYTYKDARGAVPRPEGAPLAEEAIRKGRD